MLIIWVIYRNPFFKPWAWALLHYWFIYTDWYWDYFMAWNLFNDTMINCFKNCLILIINPQSYFAISAVLHVNGMRTNWSLTSLDEDLNCLQEVAWSRQEKQNSGMIASRHVYYLNPPHHWQLRRMMQQQSTEHVMILDGFN